MVDPLISGGAVWVAGRWISREEDLVPREEARGMRAAIPAEAHLGGDRIARADRVTQLAALAVARALALVGQGPAGDALAVITASALASAHTNERFERRRAKGLAPEPRSFPYTAPNAAGGEIAVALRARGPSLALVGGPEVSLAALERACAWITGGECARVVVAAFECPPEDQGLVVSPGIAAVECAAALVLDAGCAQYGLRVALHYCADTLDDTDDERAAGLFSVAPLARVLFAAARGGGVVRARAAAGAWLEARVG